MLHFNIKFDPLKVLIALFCILAMSFVSAAPASPDPAPNILSLWITNHWPICALVISEALAFVPTKYAGIAKALFSFVNDLLTKKDSSQ